MAAQSGGTARMKEFLKALKPWFTTSKIIAYAVLIIDVYLTKKTLGLCELAIQLDYDGTMAYLTALIGLYQAVTGVVLSAYYGKSKAENTVGGIKYESVINQNRDA